MKANAEIGIDRTIFQGFKVVSVDKAKFYKNPNEDKKYIASRNGQNLYEELMVKDKTIGCLKCDTSTNKLTLCSDRYNNLHPLTVSQYYNRIEEAFNDLRNEYGIDIIYSFDELILNQIEINATVEMANEFNAYNRLIEVLIDGVADEEQAQFFVKKRKGKCRKLGTAFISNSSRKVIIYDKAEQLGDTRGNKPDENYLRLEYSFKKKEVFNADIGKTVADLSDEKINEFFFKNFDKDFVKRFAEYRSSTQKYLVDLVNISFNENKKDWKSRLFIHISQFEKDRGIIHYITEDDVITAIRKAHNEYGIFRRSSNIINGYKKYCMDSGITLDKQDLVDEFFDKINSLRVAAEFAEDLAESNIKEASESLSENDFDETIDDLFEYSEQVQKDYLTIRNKCYDTPVYDEDEHILTYIYMEDDIDETDDYEYIPDEIFTAFYECREKAV